MTTSEKNPKVDAFLERAKKWRQEFEALRGIILDCGLFEDLKWGQPCYRSQDANIVLIHGFNDYCALLFFKGALMKDDDGILIRQTENVQSARQIRFTTLAQIIAMEPILKSYVLQAVEVEKAGLRVSFKTAADFAVPEEFQSRLDEAPDVKAAFEALTPGRQKAYILHFAAPKQSKTREARIDKSIPRILEGKGLDD